MGWRGAGQEAKRRLGTSRGAGDLWVPPNPAPALLPSWSLAVQGVLGIGVMVDPSPGLAGAPRRFALESVGSSSCLLAQVCCAAQKLLWCLQAKSVASKRGTESPAQLWGSLIPK